MPAERSILDSPFLRPLLPSWRFFDRPGHLPRLEVETDHHGWTPWMLEYKRNLFTFFRNGPGNLTLAKVSLLERLMQEASVAESAEALSRSVTFDLTKAFAEEFALIVDPKARSFRFRIQILSQLEPELGYQDLLVSETYEVQRDR